MERHLPPASYTYIIQYPLSNKSDILKSEESASSNGTNLKIHSCAFTKNGVHKLCVSVYVFVLDEHLNSACKSAAVNTVSASLTVKITLGKSESERKSLLLYVNGRKYVLKILERG